VAVVVHVVMPGMIGGVYKSFFPKEGLIAEQANASVGSSRVASLGPALDEVAQRPLLGGGLGSRIPIGPGQNSFIVDDQWLSTAMETGLVGVAVWLAVFLIFIRRMGRAARADQGPRGWFFVGLTASATAFAVGMFTYDAFSFIQVTFVLFILLALGCVGLALQAPAAVAQWRPTSRHVTSP
jgi:O-antigen ligase